MARRILITGMSGTGKSTVIEQLAARGHRAIDLDAPEWSEYGPEGDWRWREDRVQALLDAVDSDEILFLSGCAENQGKFYPQIDKVVLLSAPAEVITERLQTRTNNAYGKRPEELADTLGYLETVEPLLRRGADHEIDTRVPLEDVVAEVVSLLDD